MVQRLPYRRPVKAFEGDRIAEFVGKVPEGGESKRQEDQPA